MTLICVYMPHTDYPEDEVEAVYKGMTALKKDAQESGRLVMIAGGFNAVVGWCKPTDATRRVGAHGLGQRNDRGQMLVNWCEENQVCVANTLFRKQDDKLVTHVRKQSRRQIDFVLGH